MWVAAESLGRSLVAARDGKTVRIILPEHREDFGFDHAQSDLWAFGGQSSGTADAPIAQSVVAVMVMVDGTADLDEVDGNPLLRQWGKLAEDVLTELLALIRDRHNQHWLGLDTDRPERIWLVDLIDLDAEARLPFGGGHSTVVNVKPNEAAVSPEALEALEADLERPVAVPLHVEMLNAAKYLAWIAEPKQLRTALLSAAIGCEAAVRRALRKLAEPNQADLVELVADSPRDASVAIYTHLDKTMSAVAGRSLRDDNRELYKAAQRLFEQRNKIAHGKPDQPSDDDMSESVRVAVSVVAWLTEVAGDLTYDEVA